MANMKIVSMVAESYRQSRVEAQADIATALAIVEDELHAVLDQIEQLRSAVQSQSSERNRDAE